MLLIDREARKHQTRDRFADDDIRHVVRYPMRTLSSDEGPWDGDDDMTLFLGPARDARLLEVIVLAALDEDDQPLAIHAMRMRDKFVPYLPLR